MSPLMCSDQSSMHAWALTRSHAMLAWASMVCKVHASAAPEGMACNPSLAGDAELLECMPSKGLAACTVQVNASRAGSYLLAVLQGGEPIACSASAADAQVCCWQLRARQVHWPVQSHGLPGQGRVRGRAPECIQMLWSVLGEHAVQTHCMGSGDVEL